MKQLQWIFFILAVVALLSTGWVLGQTSSRNLQPAEAQSGQEEIDVQALENLLGLTFVPAGSTVDPSKVKTSKADAIAKAQQSGAPVKGATTVTAVLGYLTDLEAERLAQQGGKVNSALLSRPLVWIVIFRGLDLPSAGYKSNKIAHEYNIVINATTGEYIMGFIYR